MKKNKFLRLASFMLIACLATCCAVGGTFAKYTTSGSANDSARVAKWGVTVTVDSAAFEKTYDTEDAVYTGSVSVSASEDVLAPGTNGTLATYSISGIPEVAVRISAVVDLDLGDKWVVGGDVYCPLVFTVNGTVIKIDATNTDTAKLETAVENAVKAAIEKDLAAGTDLSTETSASISWAWAFEGEDAKDTALGNLATAPTISFTLTVTATQID